MRAALAQYGIAAVVFCLVDAVWLGLVAQPLYDHFLGDLLAERPNLAAAALFYAIYLAGLGHFVIGPALRDGSARRAWASGAFFGLVAYATWDLTNLAVLRDFPAALVPIDLAWGAVLSGSVSGLTYAVCRRLGDARDRPAHDRGRR